MVDGCHVKLIQKMEDGSSRESEGSRDSLRMGEEMVEQRREFAKSEITPTSFAHQTEEFCDEPLLAEVCPSMLRRRSTHPAAHFSVSK